MNQPNNPRGDANTYLAAERTFLAWLRTGIALMGFGFVVARFGLFLRELAANQGLTKIKDAGFSLPIGILLIALGIVVLFVAAIRHRRYIRAIDNGEFRQAFGSTFALLLAGALALFGLAVAIYLTAIV